MMQEPGMTGLLLFLDQTVSALERQCPLRDNTTWSFPLRFEIHRCWSLFLCVSLTSSAALADFSILEYDTTNPNGFNGDPAPDLPAADWQYVSPLLLSRGAGVVPNVGIAFNSSNWSLANTADLDSDQYIQWGWTASSQPLDLTSMTLQYDVSPAGPSQLVIAASINGGVLTTIFSDGFVDPSDETHTIDLSMFDNVQSATFRLFGFDAADLGGTLDIEEIVDGGSRGILVRGELSAVPEPGAMGSFVTLLAFTTLRRRRVVECTASAQNA